MGLIDYHMHSNFSSDSKCTIDEIVKKAKELNYREICFTQHLELAKLDPVFVTTMDKNKIPEYIRQVEAARKKYNFPVKLGLEIEYDRDCVPEIKSIISKYPFDFILGSVHTLEKVRLDQNEHAKQFYAGKTKQEIIDLYFEKMENLIKSHFFDVISHADIFRRSFQRVNIPISFEDYKEHSKRIIQLLKKEDVGFEVNSSGFTKTGEQFPAKEFIKMAFNAGIKKITIGSDTHFIEKLSKNLDKVIALVKEIGYTEIAVFDRHKASYVPISEIEK